MIYTHAVKEFRAPARITLAATDAAPLATPLLLAGQPSIERLFRP